MADEPQPQIFTISELSYLLQEVIETSFAKVRVRGELAGVKRHTSGHLYFTLKDSQAVMDGICWKGVAGKLPFAPQDGLEVICTGRITTYPARSKYQFVADHMEIAGEGTLLKLLEDRKKKLAAEGLFDLSTKKPIPFLPQRIGVITSPTGAVIHDIIHRLSDRFPLSIYLWPVLVQGPGAAEQVAAAINGFNALTENSQIPRPDVLIVARGGGSLEDLWAFNEEIVVRAAAKSQIPLISAVGHETDVTLIDYAADLRAPTPTAAAEKAVPDRAYLRQRLQSAAQSFQNKFRNIYEERLLQVDYRFDRLLQSYRGYLQHKRMTADRATLKSPLALVELLTLRLSHQHDRLIRTALHLMRRWTDRFEHQASLLETLSVYQVLRRGFALVWDQTTHVVTASHDLKPGQLVTLEFHDARRGAVIDGIEQTPQRKPSKKPLPQTKTQASFWDSETN